jgi:FtsZ-interacting cell division protein ZipA
MSTAQIIMGVLLIAAVVFGFWLEREGRRRNERARKLRREQLERLRKYRNGEIEWY